MKKESLVHLWLKGMNEVEVTSNLFTLTKQILIGQPLFIVQCVKYQCVVNPKLCTFEFIRSIKNLRSHVFPNV